jgi:hypothetical protein
VWVESCNISSGMKCYQRNVNSSHWMGDPGDDAARKERGGGVGDSKGTHTNIYIHQKERGNTDDWSRPCTT